METRRAKRVADLIQTEVAQFLLTRLRDPRLQWVTITRARVSADLHQATLYYSCYNDDQMEDAGRALERARGLIRVHIGRELRLRYVPELRFKPDEELHRSYHIVELIEKLAQGDILEPLEDEGDE